LDKSALISIFWGKFSGKGKAKDAFVACRPHKTWKWVRFWRFLSGKGKAKDVFVACRPEKNL
jgi:hypothetical protein